MRQDTKRFLLLLLFIASAQLAWPQDPAAKSASTQPKRDERVVISVGDQKITVADLHNILRAMPPQYRNYYSGQGKQLLPQYLVQTKILTAEALKQHLQDQPEVRQAMEIARDSILANAARKRIEESTPVSDQQLQELYQQRKAEFEEVHLRHILIRTETSLLTAAQTPRHPPLPEAEARKKLEDIRRQILAGSSFVEMAKTYSDDLATADAGGDLGYINRQKVVPQIADAAYTLAAGQVSDAIPTPYGLDLIKVEEKRTRPLDEVKSILAAQIRQSKFQEALKGLQNQYKVVIDTQFFAPQPQGEQRTPSH